MTQPLAGESRRARPRLGGGRFLTGYVCLALGLAAAIAAALTLGHSRSTSPGFAGSYTSGSACLGGSESNPITIDQSGQFVNLGGGPGGSFRIHDGVLQGTLRCRDGSHAPFRLEVGKGGRIAGTVEGTPVTLTTATAAHGAQSTLGPEDVVGRLLLAIAIVIVCARLAGAAGTRLGQPRVMGEVVAGILLGPTLLGAVWPDAQHYLFPAQIGPMLTGLSQVGLVLYLFLVGMEFDPTLLRGRMGQAAFVTSASVAVPLGLGLLAAVPLYTLLAPSGVRFFSFALFVGVVISITAFPVLARILDERRMLHRPVGALTLASAAIGDVADWGLVALALAVAGSASGLHALVVIGWTTLFVVGMLVFVKPFLGRAAVAYAEVGQLPIVWTGTIFVAVMLSSFASQRAGVAPIFGAFVMGSMMPRNAGLTTDVSRRFDDFVGLILLPLFFVVNGLQVDITGLDNGLLWLVALGVLGVAVAGKLGGGFIAARYAGFSSRDSGVVGVLLNTRGLTELIVLNIALGTGAISEKLFSMLVLMAIATTAMTGPGLRLLDPRRELSAQAEDELGDAEAGLPSLRSIVVAPQDERNAGGLLAIAEPLARSQPPRELVIVEVFRPTGLVANRLRDEDEVAQAARRLDVQRRLLASGGITARVAAFRSGDPARDYVRIASREQVDLLIVDGRRPLLGEGVLTGSVSRILDEAPCDVAVLVERTEMPRIDAEHPVAVPFGGAEHDWAALELGASIAAAGRTTLRLIGSAGTAETGDAGRLLAQAAMVVQGFMGVDAESVLTEPGGGIVEATADAGLLVLGLRESWRQEGVGEVRAAIARRAAVPVLFVRRGSRPGLLAHEGAELTRMRWSSLDPAPPHDGS